LYSYLWRSCFEIYLATYNVSVAYTFANPVDLYVSDSYMVAVHFTVSVPIAVYNVVFIVFLLMLLSLVLVLIFLLILILLLLLPLPLIFMLLSLELMFFF